MPVCLCCGVDKTERAFRNLKGQTYRRCMDCLAQFSPERLYIRDRGMCAICGKKVRYLKEASVDHAVPLSRGGKHEAGNVRLTHKSCNLRKGNKLDEEM